MSLSEMLHKNSPTGINRKASESDYEKLVDRNTELFDELKEKEEEISKLKKLCDQYEEEHNTMFVKWQDDIQRMTKAVHRIQLLQMDGEVSIKDLTELARILIGGNKE